MAMQDALGSEVTKLSGPTLKREVLEQSPVSLEIASIGWKGSRLQSSVEV
jgi:hypothetical protein